MAPNDGRDESSFIPKHLPQPCVLLLNVYAPLWRGGGLKRKLPQQDAYAAIIVQLWQSFPTSIMTENVYFWCLCAEIMTQTVTYRKTLKFDWRFTLGACLDADRLLKTNKPPGWREGSEDWQQNISLVMFCMLMSNKWAQLAINC